MKTIVNPAHQGHAGGFELGRGSLMPCHESPDRADLVQAAMEAADLGPVLPCEDHGLGPVLAVHDARFVTFLQTIWKDWTAQGLEGSLLPFSFPVAGRRADGPPDNLFGKLGYYCLDAGTPIVEGTWAAAYGAAQTALTGAALIAAGDRAAFALCRPPGHHAGNAVYGGYCFLNNAAIAAQALIDAGHHRVTVLDVDFHHGNGTQDIFWRRGDVQMVSLHGDPTQCYPYYQGYADECGEGPGLGKTLNLPLPPGTTWPAYAAALEQARQAIVAHRPTALVISLGVDTWEGDPISAFALTREDYPKLGPFIASLGLPTLFIMEGGYAVAEIGANVAATLTAFQNA